MADPPTSPEAPLDPIKSPAPKRRGCNAAGRLMLWGGAMALAALGACLAIGGPNGPEWLVSLLAFLFLVGGVLLVLGIVIGALWAIFIRR